MADVAASVLALRTHSMPLLAHLEELRKRIIFLGPWRARRIYLMLVLCRSHFRLMQQPIIGALRHHGIGGGLVYLNPTEPFNLYLEVALVGGLFVASPLCSISCGCSSLPDCIARKSDMLCRSCSARLVCS